MYSVWRYSGRMRDTTQLQTGILTYVLRRSQPCLRRAHLCTAHHGGNARRGREKNAQDLCRSACPGVAGSDARLITEAKRCAQSFKRCLARVSRVTYCSILTVIRAKERLPCCVSVQRTLPSPQGQQRWHPRRRSHSKSILPILICHSLQRSESSWRR